MNRLAIIILSILVLSTSSCAAKKILWDYIGTESTISVKALASVQEEERYELSAEQCSKSTDDIIDEAAFTHASATVGPFLLFFVAFLLPWMLFPGLYFKDEYNPSYNTPLLRAVPLYVKFGRLVFYS